MVTGRERHVGGAREGYLPYPQRSLRTRDFIYIVNFEPDRWPMGDPKGLDDPSTPAPDFETLAYDTFVAYADLDASPTKAWMIHHREDHDVEPLYDLAFGKRPREELYDLNEDPHYMNNVADDPGLRQCAQATRRPTDGRAHGAGRPSAHGAAVPVRVRTLCGLARIGVCTGLPA